MRIRIVALSVWLGACQSGPRPNAPETTTQVQPTNTADQRETPPKRENSSAIVGKVATKPGFRQPVPQPDCDPKIQSEAIVARLHVTHSAELSRVETASPLKNPATGDFIDLNGDGFLDYRLTGPFTANSAGGYNLQGVVASTGDSRCFQLVLEPLEEEKIYPSFREDDGWVGLDVSFHGGHDAYQVGHYFFKNGNYEKQSESQCNEGPVNEKKPPCEINGEPWPPKPE